LFLVFVFVYTHTFCPYFFHLIQVLGALDDADELYDALIPSSLAECQRLSELFRRGGRNPLKGSASALDGLAIKIQRPRLSDVPNPIGYYNRKGIFSPSTSKQ